MASWERIWLIVYDDTRQGNRTLVEIVTLGIQRENTGGKNGRFGLVRALESRGLRSARRRWQAQCSTRRRTKPLEEGY